VPLKREVARRIKNEILRFAPKVPPFLQPKLARLVEMLNMKFHFSFSPLDKTSFCKKCGSFDVKIRVKNKKIYAFCNCCGNYRIINPLKGRLAKKGERNVRKRADKC